MVGQTRMSWHSIRGRMAALVGLAVVALLLVAGLSQVTLSRLKVNGPIYHEIVRNKDLVADILPPPEYIIESDLVAHQLVRATDPAEVAHLAAKLDSLKSDYTVRHEYWVGALANDSLRQTLLVQSYEPATRFFAAVDREFLPAIKAGQRARAGEILDQTLQPLYHEHRAAIDRVVALANAHSAEDEAAAAVTIRRQTLLLLAVAAVAFLALLFVGRAISFGMLTPLEQTVSALEGVATGNLAPVVPRSTLSEVRRMSEALGHTLDGIRTALATEKVDWADVGRQRAEITRIQQLVEYAPINIMYADRDLALRYLNPAARRNSATLAGALARTGDALVGAPLDAFHADAEYRRVLADPGRAPHPMRFTIGGETIDALACGIRGADGTGTGVMLTWEIVTARLEAERKVREAQEEALRSAEERRRVESEAAGQRQREAAARRPSSVSGPRRSGAAPKNFRARSTRSCRWSMPPAAATSPARSGYAAPTRWDGSAKG